jgi:hypothetical protein
MTRKWAGKQPTPEQIERILADHKEWLDNGGEGEAPHSLAGANLVEANFEFAKLKGADFTGASLEGADLTGAQISEANLQGTDLKGANLKNANFKGAYARESNLAGAKLDGDALARYARQLFQIMKSARDSASKNPALPGALRAPPKPGDEEES